jgi:hypothetical protein
MRSSLADAPLVVSTDGTAGPYVTVRTDQLKPVVQALQSHGVNIEVDEDAVVLDGRPALAVIDLDRGTDLERVQGILDRLEATWRGAGVESKLAPVSQNEFIVKIEPSESPELIRRLEAAPPVGWSRRRDLEERMRTMRAVKAGVYCLTKNFEPGPGEVAVWLETRGAGELCVSTIIPLKSRRSLSVDQYNQVIGDFQKTFVEPLTSGLKRHIFNYQVPAGPTLEDVLSANSMRRLESFSATANKSMLHPLDLQRWRVFVARTHLEDAVIESVLLSDWLMGEGWPDDQRGRLIAEYELGRSLLSVYDEERVDR